MATFTVKIDCDNAAFDDGTGEEIARILRQIADRVEEEYPDISAFQTILDINGNDVGRWALKGMKGSMFT